jgi:hypothetical protein
MALSTVAQIIADVRVLLQDTIAPYRYTDDELVIALNVTLLDTRRIRPDLFLGDGTTTNFDDPAPFTAVNTDEVDIENGFRPAIVFGVVGHALWRDQEDIQDNRASAFIDMYNKKLLGLN